MLVISGFGNRRADRERDMGYTPLVVASFPRMQVRVRVWEDIRLRQRQNARMLRAVGEDVHTALDK
jgi:hypothetical protein